MVDLTGVCFPEVPCLREASSFGEEGIGGILHITKRLVTIPRHLSHLFGIFILIADIPHGRINGDHEDEDDHEAQNRPTNCLSKVLIGRLHCGRRGRHSGHSHSGVSKERRGKKY